MTVTPVLPHQSVFQLAKALPTSPAFHRIYTVQQGWPKCIATPELETKYGVAQQNEQHVLSITNTVSLRQCWFNEARGRKPQNFVGQSGVVDPTAGKACDFCSWQTLTAADTWGRAEGVHAVSASNLFKYVAPAQGVILFKHHDPLQFDLPQLQDLVNVAHGWFQQATLAAEAEGHAPQDLHPLLVWNCLGRAGASQFHGHAQVMLSASQFPEQARQEAAALHYMQRHGSSYQADLQQAHQSVGLLWQAQSSAGSVNGSRHGSSAGQVDASYLLPSLAPWKDCEVLLHGSHMCSPTFQLLLFAALRALIDELGVQTFNAAISFERNADGPCTARLVSRGKLSSAASDFGGLEVFGGASIAHTDPFAVGAAVDRVLARLGSNTGDVQVQRL